MSAGYLGLDLHKPADERSLPDPIRTAGEQLQAAGAGYLIVNADPKGSWSHPEIKTENELKRQGENLSLIARIAREYGLRTCFHNHADELVLCDGDLRSVIQYASNDVLLCLDTAWAWASGISAAQLDSGISRKNRRRSSEKRLRQHAHRRSAGRGDFNGGNHGCIESGTLRRMADARALASPGHRRLPQHEGGLSPFD